MCQSKKFSLFILIVSLLHTCMYDSTYMPMLMPVLMMQMLMLMLMPGKTQKRNRAKTIKLGESLFVR